MGTQLTRCLLLSVAALRGPLSHKPFPLNNQTAGESLYWYFVLFILTKAVNNPEPQHLLHRRSSKRFAVSLLEVFCCFCSLKIIAWCLVCSSGTSGFENNINSIGNLGGINYYGQDSYFCHMFTKSFLITDWLLLPYWVGKLALCIFPELQIVTSGAVPLVSPCSEGAPGFYTTKANRDVPVLNLHVGPCLRAHPPAVPRNNLQFGHASVKCILQTAHGVSFIYVWLCRALEPQIESWLRNKWIATQIEEGMQYSTLWRSEFYVEEKHTAVI